MGTVHSLPGAYAPERIRRRFNLAAVDRSGPARPEGGMDSDEAFVVGTCIVMFQETAERFADDVMRELTFLWISAAYRNLRFFSLIP